jgi:hypothetical protein
MSYPMALPARFALKPQLLCPYHDIYVQAKIRFTEAKSNYRHSSDFVTLSQRQRQCLRDNVSTNETETMSQQMRHCLTISYCLTNLRQCLKGLKKTNSGTLRKDRAQAAVPACVQIPLI